jgi:hypothetical protein
MVGLAGRLPENKEFSATDRTESQESPKQGSLSRTIGSKDPDEFSACGREIHILKIVRHPQVVQLYEIIET